MNLFRGDPIGNSSFQQHDTSNAPQDSATPLPSNEPNQRQNEKNRVCVIGAGPSGLITLKELLEAGQDVVCYEQGDQVGGVFCNAWKGATMTSSNLLTAFGCYPLHIYSQETGASNNVTMWTCQEYCKYLQGFTNHFSLQPHIRLGTKVAFVQQTNNGEQWIVGIQQTGDSKSEVRVETFDAIAVCSGMHQQPNISSWCQQYENTSNRKRKRNNIKIVHSSQVISGSDYKDKNVVLIGLGESGSDLALLIAPHAASLTLSVRQNGSGHVLSRYTNGEVSDLNTSRGYGADEVWSQADYEKFAKLVRNAGNANDEKALRNLARCYSGADSFSDLDLMAIEWNARYRNAPYNRYGTKNFSFLEAIRSHGATAIGEITCANDLPEDTDMVILCTGYVGTFPFLEQYLPELNGRSSRHRDRYNHLIDLEVGVSLAFIGFSRPAFGAVPPLSELSARYWAMMLTGERVLSKDVERQLLKSRLYEERLFRRDATRIQSLVCYNKMMDTLAKCIGCEPPLDDLQSHQPRVHARVMHSCLSAAQFRLVEPGSTKDSWIAVLESPLPQYSRQPRSAFHLKVKAGLLG